MKLGDEPTEWMGCSECKTAYIICRRWSFSKGWVWLWGPECKCGKRRRNPAPPTIFNKDGEFIAVEEGEFVEPEASG